jgi:hypothetical protein
MAELTERETEILEALVRLSETPDYSAFSIAPGADRLEVPDWPEGNAAPTRDEVRGLVARDLLEIDKSKARTWCFWPSEEASAIFAGPSEQALAQALKHPDQRLGVILDAIVNAFEADPSTPLLLLRTDQVDIVRHPHWGIAPDVVRLHDLRQLEELRLIGWEGATQFYPTQWGRTAARNPAAFLSQRADETEDDQERSRLRSWAEKIRAGDVAVGTAGSLTGTAIRVALGL